jgi:hypothetical protein
MPHKSPKVPPWTFDQHLTPRETRTEVASDGLRYASKTPGSPFASLNGFSSSTMSCFLCGQHRPRSLMKPRRLIGRTHLVCDPGCAPQGGG